MKNGRMGIMPIGALSIAFANHVQGIDTFIESKKTHYGIGTKLKIINQHTKEIILTNENYTNDISSLIDERMPEIILFSPPNHRLISTLDEVINTIYKILETHPDLGENVVPKILMLSNGIYYDDVMDYITKKFESVDNSIREKIKGNIVRGTTLQTGVRIENEDMDKDMGAIFKPGTKGSITIAGGSKESRERIISLFKEHNYPVFEMEGEEVRRIEFDKAIINLSTNAVQLSLLIDDDGNVHNFTMGDLISDKKMQDICKKIIHTMVSIGAKSGIYKQKEQQKEQQEDKQQKQLIDKISQEIWTKIEEKSRTDNVHIVSSIAAVIERYRKGKLENKPLRLPPLEENIINYLLNLSKEYHLEEEKIAIEELRDSILHTCGKVWC